MTEPLIRARGVRRVYPGAKPVEALRGVDFEIAAGERVAVMGPSGSGKSTLLHLLGGLDRPDDGELSVAGRVLGGMSDGELTRYRREAVGFIFQFFNLLPTLTARQNIALPMELARAPRARVDARADELLARVGLADRADHLPDQLSGGQRQRVAIARALVMNPPLLLADEPTGNLDSATTREILDLLVQINGESGTTLVMVTHDPLAAADCHRVLTLRDGAITREQSAA